MDGVLPLLVPHACLGNGQPESATICAPSPWRAGDVQQKRADLGCMGHRHAMGLSSLATHAPQEQEETIFPSDVDVWLGKRNWLHGLGMQHHHHPGLLAQPSHQHGAEPPTPLAPAMAVYTGPILENPVGAWFSFLPG